MKTKRVTKALAANKYHANFTNNGHQPNRQHEINDTNQRGLVIPPYAKGFSERVTKFLQSFNIKVAYKPIRSIPTVIKKPNDTMDRERGFQRNRVQAQI